MHGPLSVKAEMSSDICASVASSPKRSYTACSFSYKRPSLTSIDHYMSYQSKQLDICTGKSYSAGPSTRTVYGVGLVGSNPTGGMNACLL